MELNRFKMPIKNLTKKEVISNHYKLCDNILSKFMGLMFSKPEKIKDFLGPENSKNFLGKQNNALIFKFNKEKTIELHMLFVFYPIDVLFLNKNKVVVDKKEDFKPFTFYKSKKKAMYAIELPNGVVRKTKTEIGDKIEIWSHKKRMDC